MDRPRRTGRGGSMKAMKARATRARNAALVTCPASRHVHAMALLMAEGKPVHDLPQDAAESMLAVCTALWEARAEIGKLKGNKP